MDKDVFLAKLAALWSEYTGNPNTVEIAAPPGFVTVQPTGPKGAGKTRFWPVPIHQNPDDPTAYYDVNYLSYLGRMMRFTNTFAGKGEPYCQPGRYTSAFYPSPGDDALSFPQRADKSVNPFDWFDQPMLDNIDALAERDKNTDFSGGRR